jgi:hypothetical protein
VLARDDHAAAPEPGTPCFHRQKRRVTKVDRRRTSNAND